MNLTARLEKKYVRKVEEAPISNCASSYSLGCGVEKIILKSSLPEKSRPQNHLLDREQYLARGLLEQLVGENGNKTNASRVICLVQRFLHSLQNNRFNLNVYDKIPTEREALEFYNASKQAVKEGRLDKPWRFISGYGEKTFKLLEAYLRIRKII